MIFGNAPGLNDTLSGLVDLRTRRVDASGGSAAVSFTGDSCTGLNDLDVESDVGLDEDMLGDREVGCEINEERLLDSGLLIISAIRADGFCAGSEVGLGNEVLGGLDVAEADEDLLFETSPFTVSIAGLIGFVDGSESGLMNDIVLDRLRGGFSSLTVLSIGVCGFFTSGSLYSNFPLLSAAKYSSPRPNTT